MGLDGFLPAAVAGRDRLVGPSHRSLHGRKAGRWPAGVNPGALVQPFLHLTPLEARLKKVLAQRLTRLDFAGTAFIIPTLEPRKRGWVTARGSDCLALPSAPDGAPSRTLTHGFLCKVRPTRIDSPFRAVKLNDPQPRAGAHGQRHLATAVDAAPASTGRDALGAANRCHPHFWRAERASADGPRLFQGPASALHERAALRV